MPNRPSILFLHGLQSGPHGAKYHALCEVFDVESPDFRGMSLHERLDHLDTLTRERSDLFAVGSSFGGLLAAVAYSNFADRFRGYVLLAPALQRELSAEVERVPPIAVILHGIHDEVVPIEASRDFATRFDVELVELDDDHRLRNSHAEMIAAIRRLSDESP